MSADDHLLLYRRSGPGLPRRDLRLFASTLQSQVAGGRTFSCLLTDDRELQRLNKQFLGKDYPTDVLSFPSREETTLGEIAISVDRARAQAAFQRHEVADEIRILLLHGVLHLLGMDHENDKGEMARAEKRWRKTLSLPDNLIARGQQ